jgi:hypothetical protein
LKAQSIAKAILADRQRVKAERADITKCFMCGHGTMCRGSRFCSQRCRDYYDEGNPRQVPKPVCRWRDGRPMAMGPHGFLINCAHCGKEFDSKGLRCCSKECEGSCRQRENNPAVTAKVGTEAAPKRQCQTFGVRIPKWRGGRKVSSKTRFCSPARAKGPKDQNAGNER